MHTNTPTPTQPRMDPRCAMPPCSQVRISDRRANLYLAKQGYICHKFRTKTYSVFFPAPCRACCYQGLRAERELLWDTEVPRAQRCYYSLIACSSKAPRCLLEMDVKKCLRVIRGKKSLLNKDKKKLLKSSLLKFVINYFFFFWSFEKLKISNTSLTFSWDV